MSRRLWRAARAWLGLRPGATPVARRIMPSTCALPERPVFDRLVRLATALAAAAGLALLAPLMLLIALAVRLTSPGPALYRGARVGRDRRVFTIYKFRTMKVGSERRIGGRLVRQDEDHFTAIGPFLRRYRLDELPQLFNVLRGDMALVGPRPLRPIFLERHLADIPGYGRRFAVRPGITGLAQVRGGYYTRPRHKLLYDVLYIRRRSARLDLGLIGLTFVRLLSRIFTTTLLFGWLLVTVLLLPPAVHRALTLRLGGFEVNPLYLVPPLTVLFHLLRRRAERARTTALRTPVDLPLVGFLGISALALPFGPDPLASLRGLGWYVCNGAVVFGLVLNSRMVTTARGPLIGALVAATAAMGLLDLGPRLAGALAGEGFGRVSGTLVSPILFATVVVLALPLALSRGRHARGAVRVAWRLGAAALLVTGVATLTRSGVLAGALALAVYLAPRGRRAVLGVGLGFALLVAGLAGLGDARLQPERAVIDVQRVVERQQAVLAALDADPALPDLHWMTGVGPRVLGRLAQRDGWRDHKPPLELHSMYLTILVDHGPLGLVFFLGFLFGGLRVMARTPITDPRARDDLRASLAGLCGCALLFGVSDGLYALPVALLFFAAMAIGVGLAAHYGPGPRAVYRIARRHEPL